MHGAIPWPRVRRLARLVGELREIGIGEAARQHLLDGLLGLVGASLGVAVLDHDYRPGGSHGIRAATLAGYDGKARSMLAAHNARGTSFNPFHLGMMEARARVKEEVFAARRVEVVASRAWYRAAYFNECVAPLGVDDSMAAFRELGPHRVEGIALVRERRARPFSDEDRDVLQLVQLEAPRLFGAPDDPTPPRVRFSDRAIARLSRDERAVAELAAIGHSDVAIAATRGSSVLAVRALLAGAVAKSRADELGAAGSRALDFALTPRQSQALERLVRGLSNKEIAAELGCAENTVELHLTQVYRKTGVQGRLQLIAWFWAGALHS